MLTSLILSAFLSLPASVTVPPSIDSITKVSPPIVVEVNSFDEESAKRFEEQMDKAQTTGQKVIPVVIDSFGGEVYALLRMVDIVLQSKVPVATICEGKCMSAGAILLAVGHEGMRYAGPNATILFHEIAGGFGGKLRDLKVTMSEVERLNNHVLSLVSLHTGHDKNFFAKQLHYAEHTDMYFTPEQAKRLNIINHISLPSLRLVVKSEYVLE